MNAAQFIPAAAAVFGIAETELRTVDRALSDAGLREKAVGRNYPDVTRTEAVRLLLGVCAAPRLTDAGRIVSEVETSIRNVVTDVERFTGQIPHPTETDDDFCFASFRFTRKEAVAMTIVQAIERVCGWLASADAPNWVVEVEISVGGTVAIQARDWDDDRRAVIYFTGAMSFNGYPGIETVRHVRKHVLRWIGANTEVRP